MGDPIRQRVYVCPVIGDGSEEYPWRPILADLLAGIDGLSWHAAIHVEGGYTWGIVRVEYPQSLTVANRRSLHEAVKAAGCHDLPASLRTQRIPMARDVVLEGMTGFPLGEDWESSVEPMLRAVSAQSKPIPDEVMARFSEPEA